MKSLILLAIQPWAALPRGGRWATSRGRRDVQECGAGLVTVREEGDVLSFATPPLRREEPLSPADLKEACGGLGLDSADIVDHGWVDNGPGWRLLQLRDAETVRAVKPQGERPKVGVVGPNPNAIPQHKAAK